MCSHTIGHPRHTEWELRSKVQSNMYSMIPFTYKK